ncbi:integral membrane protein [Brucella abortus]|nr:integral membrane protein [Brucella abortus]SUW38759.1 integral membrane protein [Brucella abortus]
MTITGALEIIDYLLTNEPGGGAFTPAQLLGPGLVERLPESGPLEII